MRWYQDQNRKTRTAQSNWREEAEQEANAAADKGLVDDDLPGWSQSSWHEPGACHVPGTDVVILAEKEADPWGRSEWNWIVTSPDGIIDDGFPGQLEELARKHSARRYSRPAPNPQPKAPSPADRLQEVVGQLYDIGNRNDPRARPLLDEYRRLTGKDAPGFMS